ncbi:MAG: ABC transporter ATP-binding protein [Eubacteriales bacterium]|nr:ABC transporter ATP-binding protein [Eubacteriales bacterium]
MIELKSVSKTYGGRIKAVDNMSLDIDSGCIYGFLGPNGAGKTTTIKLITGIIKPDGGTILVDGDDVQKDPLAVKKNIGFVPDDPNIFLRLKGIEYLSFMADIYDVGSGDREQAISELARRFEMSNALGDRIQSYSHGMRQKIVIMGALLHKPKVWILDEPMTGLDPKSAFELKTMMREHADEGNTVFFSTHVLEVAEKVCDKVAVVGSGHILFAGSIHDMKKSGDASLEKMFLEMTQNA